MPLVDANTSATAAAAMAQSEASSPRHRYYPGPIARACGYRELGALYVEVGMSVDGKPLEHFLIDEPWIVPEGLPIPDRGVVLLNIGGIYHIVDRVGENNYPNVADILEEGRAYGFSRKIQRTLDLSVLTPGQSKLLLVHDKGYIENAREYYAYQSRRIGLCPTDRHNPVESVPCCCRIWWHDIAPGSARIYGDLSCTRSIGRTAYTAYGRPKEVTPIYHRAFIAALPIGRFAYIDGVSDQYHQPRVTAGTLAKLQRSTPMAIVASAY